MTQCEWCHKESRGIIEARDIDLLLHGKQWDCQCLLRYCNTYPCSAPNRGKLHTAVIVFLFADDPEAC